MKVAEITQNETPPEKKPLSLKVLLSSGVEYPVTIEGSSTVLALKQQLENACSAPPSEQRLFHRGCELSSQTQSLQDVGILDGQKLHLVVQTLPRHDGSQNEAFAAVTSVTSVDVLIDNPEICGPPPGTRVPAVTPDGIPVADQPSFWRQLFIPSHSGVAVSLGGYADAAETQAPVAPSVGSAVQDQLQPAEATTNTSGQPAEGPSFWEQLFFPSHSGVEVSLGAYAYAADSPAVGVPPPPPAQEDPQPTSASASESIPWWYKLLVPSDSGTVATLGSYADPASLPPDVPQVTSDAPPIPWDRVGGAFGLQPPDRDFMRAELEASRAQAV
jgi:hypothetical protein